MKVLVIGKGGREHALLWRLNQSETARKLYCAGGNPGISQLAQVIPVAQNDFAGSDPGQAVLNQHFARQSGDTLTLAIRSQGKITDPAVRDQVTAALQPFKGAAGYISSKAAVIAFSTAVAVEYRDDGIRCNAILPSVIDTPGNRASQPDADHSKWVAPEEIARVVRFLCSEDSAPVSGAHVPVYGKA